MTASAMQANTGYFRDAMATTGFTIAGKDHPISPAMPRCRRSSPTSCWNTAFYAIGFFYPVVPQGAARIRTQISAAHTREQLDKGIEAFVKAGKELGVI